MSGQTGRCLQRALFQTLEAAPEADSLEALTELFRPTLLEVGFGYFSVVEASLSPKNRSLTVLFGLAHDAWCQVYAHEGLAGVDPRMRHMLGSAEPAYLSELTPSRSTPASPSFMDRFRAYGFEDSFVWPVHLPEGRVRAVLMLRGTEDRSGPQRAAAAALASGYHTAGAKILRRLKTNDGVEVKLRPRQRDCLYWARQGKSSSDIGAILGISPRTVDEHIAHACEALGVRTRIQAVARAVLLGLF